jgi:transitional endoplasmic reticulum ATPase
VVRINSGELSSDIVGDAEQYVRGVFAAARSARRASVILIESIDEICPSRTNALGSDHRTHRMVATMLAQLDGVNSRGNVSYLLGATRTL